MSANITAQDLDLIFARWNQYDIPIAAKNKVMEHSLKVVDKIFDLITFMGTFDPGTSYTLGEETSKVVSPSLIACYYIGYELASGRMSRTDGSDYLSAATQPIGNFVLKIVSQLIVRDTSHQEDVRAIALEIAKATGEVSSDICILGIENFRSIGHQ